MPTAPAGRALYRERDGCRGQADMATAWLQSQLGPVAIAMPPNWAFCDGANRDRTGDLLLSNPPRRANANVAAVAAMKDHAREVGDEARREREEAERKLTVREISATRSPQPSRTTCSCPRARDPHKRGNKVRAGRIMSALGIAATTVGSVGRIPAVCSGYDLPGYRPTSPWVYSSYSGGPDSNRTQRVS